MHSLLALAITLTASVAFGGEDTLVVHEWGTFTSLQDSNGIAIGGVRPNAEPLPNFVHDQGLLGSKGNTAGYEPGSLVGKTGTAALSEITMRLETPVIYFYPSAQKVSQVRVEVTFPHGWITEYYPNGLVDNPGLKERKIPADSPGTLIWSDLELSGREDGPATNSRIWLAPRAVDATSVKTLAGERERYLFYRGVAKLDSPVKAVTKGDELIFEAAPAWQGQVKHLYVLADFRPDGRCAYRSVPAGVREPKLSPRFSENEYSKNNHAIIRELLRKQLIDDGLFPKEAEAMLNTWEHSYFRSEGLRVFFLTPKTWTDEVLPLKISPAAEVTRVMIGRIELRRRN